MEGYILGNEAIGEGSFGRVMSAIDKVGKPVAIKIESTNSKFPQVEREYRMMRHIRHFCNVVPQPLALLSSPRERWLVMELGGPTLRSVFHHTVSEAQFAHVALQMLTCLYLCHMRAGIVHRDVKPDNFIASRDGGWRVLLMDFWAGQKFSTGQRRSHSLAPPPTVHGHQSLLCDWQSRMGAPSDAKTTSRV